MRKFQQKQLLDILKTFEEAHSEINRLLSKKDIQSVAALLADCQKNALQVGEIIERLEGMDTKTVPLLEEYCDLLYKVSVEINDTQISSKITNKLQKHLIKIENSILSDLKPNRLEILFIPYKASMWDSMESVWLAAKADPQCDAVVMPIPYFDMLPNKMPGKMHYEGNQYPEYVPVTDWQKYDIKNRHPDIIVMHNPYDDGNLVTRVHPNYYSKLLKDFTDLLVYIPYFVSFDRNTCFGSGLLYADKVIVQSGGVREAYLDEYRMFEEKNNCKDFFGNAEKKFAALGSPKFDKVINTKTEDLNIPENWLKLIDKPDGTRKKIILLNTTISGLLFGNENVLIKLRYIFECFRKTEDVVLLWRPHPLNTTAYESMRPALLNEYKEIVADFRDGAWGIYDDSADLSRAISVSDKYFGDCSSLVPLFLCTGKPIMLQTVENYPPAEIKYFASPADISKPIDCCYIENHDMTLSDFILGNYNRTEAEALHKRQLELCGELADNLDGTAGTKIYEYFKKTLSIGGEIK